MIAEFVKSKFIRQTKTVCWSQVEKNKYAFCKVY